jgi:hypothetical protein
MLSNTLALCRPLSDETRYTCKCCLDASSHYTVPCHILRGSNNNKQGIQGAWRTVQPSDANQNVSVGNSTTGLLRVPLRYRQLDHDHINNSKRRLKHPDLHHLCQQRYVKRLCIQEHTKTKKERRSDRTEVGDEGSSRVQPDVPRSLSGVDIDIRWLCTELAHLEGK